MDEGVVQVTPSVDCCDAELSVSGGKKESPAAAFPLIYDRGRIFTTVSYL
jgi:hypothetical protein